MNIYRRKILHTSPVKRLRIPCAAALGNHLQRTFAAELEDDRQGSEGAVGAGGGRRLRSAAGAIARAKGAKSCVFP